MLTVGSTFTGVGGADLGLELAGFRIAWQCELDPWKRSILRAHWPEVPIYDDIRTIADQVAGIRRIQPEGDGRCDSHSTPQSCPQGVDLLIGGFPCQDLSVAGKRKGFDGERSVLAFEFLRVAESLAPRWLVLENVPGLLSSNRGRDFARLVDEVVGCGYGVAWRVLDARYFGVPQRRRRVFLVARRADAVVDSGAASRLALRALLESGSGDPTPGWPPRQDTPADAGGSPDAGGIFNATAAFGAWVEERNARELSQRDYKSPNHLVSFRKSKRAQSDQDDETWVESDATNTLNRFDTGDVRATQVVASTLQASGKSGGHRIDAEGAAGGHLIPQVTSTLQAQHGRGFACNAEMAAGGQLIPTGFSAGQSSDAGSIGYEPGMSPTLRAAPSGSNQVPTLHEHTTVRRLTPTECERLMGWPDGWTAPEGVKAPDSKRYAACGDGIVSWVAYWIGQRIKMIEEKA